MEVPQTTVIKGDATDNCLSSIHGLRNNINIENLLAVFNLACCFRKHVEIGTSSFVWIYPASFRLCLSKYQNMQYKRILKRPFVFGFQKDKRPFTQGLPDLSGVCLVLVD